MYNNMDEHDSSQGLKNLAFSRVIHYKDWTDEFYNWKCGLYEAKHQCMLANNVIILREQDIKNLSVDMFL